MRQATCSSVVVSVSDECSNINEDEVLDDKTDLSLDSDRSSESTVIKSKSTGWTKKH